MRSLWGIAGFLTLGTLVACSQSFGAGRSVYNEHCVMCHGASGQGDGEFANQLLKLPPDLTRLTRENGGTFPRLRVEQAITGSGRGEHFSGAVPEFADFGANKATPQTLQAIVDYVESIQI